MAKMMAPATRNILIVEDDIFVSMDAAEAVARAGNNVITTESVHDALAILETEQISGAIVDFKLRDGDVTALVHKLRRLEIPFKVVSGFAAREIEARGISSRYYAPKPADYRQVLAAILSPSKCD